MRRTERGVSVWGGKPHCCPNCICKGTRRGKEEHQCCIICKPLLTALHLHWGCYVKKASESRVVGEDTKSAYRNIIVGSLG
jgi:hypothetical protein